LYCQNTFIFVTECSILGTPPIKKFRYHMEDPIMLRLLFYSFYLEIPDSQTWKDRFWAESVINFRCQKGNKFHRICNIWWCQQIAARQNLLTFYASRLAIEIKQNLLRIWRQTDSRNRAGSALSLNISKIAAR